MGLLPTVSDDCAASVWPVVYQQRAQDAGALDYKIKIRRERVPRPPRFRRLYASALQELSDGLQKYVGE